MAKKRRYRLVAQPPAPVYRQPARPRHTHRLLRSQLRRKLGLADATHLQAALASLAALSQRVQNEDPDTARVLGGIGALLDDVATAYAHHDINVTLLQRSLDLTSEEWFAANERLRQELAIRSRALQTLRNALSGLLREDSGQRAANDADDIEQVAAQIAILTAERALAEEQLRLWRKVFEASREGIVITDSQERILSANSAVRVITGYDVEEILGQTPRLFASGQHDRDFFRAMWAALDADGYWQGEIWDRRKSGEIYPKWLAISAVRNPKGEVTHYIASFADITERKNNEERIRHIAYHDALTGLPNRLLLRDRFEQEIAHARRVGARVELLFLDLDHFKNINDSLGHPVGDKLLCAASARLKSCLRETDIISRQGGDEFVIVLSGRGADNLPHIARKLLDRLNEPFEIDGHTLNASSSIGIGVFPDDGDDFDTLLQKADTALYRAKEDGRGTYRYFDRQMDKAAQERMTVESCLRGALERGELSLHYQPQVNLKSGAIVGVEALLRWTSPELGAVAPARFIPIAEDDGMILAIGAWVLREACRAARAWHDGGWPGLTVAVNLSAVQFRRGDLAKTLAQALDESGVDPSCIELELTESILIEEAETTLAMVRRLKEYGVRLSIDDFGTGYSSLAYLKRFAVDRLKIDRSFVGGLPDDSDDAAIVSAVIEMAHSLKLGIVAEGVETEAQAAFLRRAGCEQAQGYLYGKPDLEPLAIAAAPSPRLHLRVLGD